MKTLLRITALVPSTLTDALTLHLTMNAPGGWQEEERPDGRTAFTLHLDQGPAAQALEQDIAARWPEAEITRDEIQEQDWALAWREFFTPVHAGSTFTVLPPWLADQAPAGRIPIVIEPKQAFGTGHHGTTALCLGALAGLREAGLLHPGDDFLDLGTGSGILALGCCLLGLHGVGLDIDPLAIENAVENRDINGAQQSLHLAVGSLEALAPERTFRLVLANILAGPLKVMAPQLRARVAPGGCLVLSGILTEQADSVADAYTALGLPAPRRENSGEWTALVWEQVA
ncbi:50S ribosomal protein L11 methyltransferase [Desulfocurvus sp.]|jgi:ribosomal protein L11 methyltransferase|uniref:50S ribosomal protein L11 methyltransferase n=1 Tax=Desulfocurvus sp. TaxID=2871698 RepID=UPI0025B87378|nr:50S ribosomal protein L11 methyltransferase [Desulfocurvus sp.]MCK9240862.1 50S ribosomal protein L11 methyltransferase [Desulfocurvus sp.]